jgi:hypothetical protein
MALVDDVIARLKAQVPALQNRVEGAADLTALVARGELPQVTPAAHVVPAGMTAGSVRTANTGFYSQAVGRLVSVVLAFRGRDKTATRGLDGVSGVIDAVLAAICGWTPDPATTGVFEMRGLRLVSMAGDALVYQIDFVLPDHLEVMT